MTKRMSKKEFLELLWWMVRHPIVSGQALRELFREERQKRKNG